MDVILAAAALAFSILVILWKTRLFAYVLPYQGFLDIAVTVALFVAFSSQGAVTSILIAIFGGLFFSGACSLLYRVMPQRKLRKTATREGRSKWRFVDVPPAWRR